MHMTLPGQINSKTYALRNACVAHLPCFICREAERLLYLFVFPVFLCLVSSHISYSLAGLLLKCLF